MPPSPDRPHRFRILLLGNAPGWPDPVSTALEDQGIDVCRAGSVPQAVDLLEQMAPDAVVIDASGADEAALEACSRLREQIGRRPIPILVLSRRGDEEAIEAAFDAGAADYFVDTGHWKLLAERLAQLVASARLRHQLASSRRQPQPMPAPHPMGVAMSPSGDPHHRPGRPDRDTLTGLLNRDGFIAAAHELLVEAEPYPDAPVRALLLVNIDRFKRLNDSLGTSVGDRVLQDVGERLRRAFRNLDRVAIGRLASDEFALAFPGLRSVHAAERAAEIVLAELRRPVNCGGLECVLRVSIGIAIADEAGDSDTVESLLGLAGRALTAVKFAGGNGARRFEPSLVAGGRERFGLEISLHHALDRRELALHYQPIVDPRSGRIGGVEALMRWRHQDRVIAPAEFIPIAEETGLIRRLGEWAIGQALHQLRLWRDAGTPVSMVAVNIHVGQLTDPTLAQIVSDALEVNGLEPSMLELELTETGVMRDIERSLASLQRLRQLGVRLALDDFGTGYSSLAYLTQLPLDTLKIDGSFVRRLDDSDQSRAVVRAIIALAQALGLETVAEGVETGSQLDALQALGCDEMQGFYYAPPLSARELPEWWHRFTGADVASAPPADGPFGAGPSGTLYV